jgi:hypothetical protein
MTTLTIDVPSHVYEQLRAAANQRGKPVEAIAQEWLAEKSAATSSPMSEREKLRVALRAVGLLAEPTPEMRKLAEESTLTLDEARAILDRVGGKPLSEVILEMRGPKE